MKEIVIREVVAAEVILYKDFLRKGLINDEDNFRITPLDDSREPFPTRDAQDSFTLGAFVDGCLCGVVSFERDGSNREKLRHKGILFRMYVAATYRGMGISKLLIDELLRRARNIEDIEQINLTVISANMAAKKLYGQYGFKSFGKEERAIKWQGKYFDEEQMVLVLKNIH